MPVSVLSPAPIMAKPVVVVGAPTGPTGPSPGSTGPTGKTGPTGSTGFVGQTGPTGLGVTGVFVPNSTVATVMSSLGPTGAATAIQKWMAVNDAGVTRYIPCW